MIAKKEQHELETSIYNSQGAVRDLFHRWLRLHVDKNNNDWPLRTGDELLQLQGEQRAFVRLLNVIETGPKYKEIGNG